MNDESINHNEDEGIGMALLHKNISLLISRKGRNFCSVCVCVRERERERDMESKTHKELEGLG